MGDPYSRKNATLNRLRQQLRKKRESLADQFEFKMYMAFHFKDKHARAGDKYVMPCWKVQSGLLATLSHPDHTRFRFVKSGGLQVDIRPDRTFQQGKKSCGLFEIAEVVPVMTNNYEDSILKGAKEEAYSYESSRELLEKDVVQLHAPRWQSMRKDVIGCTTEVDFFLWPRTDIDRIECLLFSRWKGENEQFKPLKAEFEFSSADYEKQLMRLLARKDKTGLIINNPAQSMFLFIDRQHLETHKNKAIVFKLSSVCLYLPQDQLTYWGPGTSEEVLAPYLSG